MNINKYIILLPEYNDLSDEDKKKCIKEVAKWGQKELKKINSSQETPSESEDWWSEGVGRIARTYATVFDGPNNPVYTMGDPPAYVTHHINGQATRAQRESASDRIIREMAVDFASESPTPGF